MATERKNPSPKRQLFIGLLLGLVLMSSTGLFVVSAKRAEAFPGEALAAAIWKEAKDQIRSIRLRIQTLAQVAYKQSKDVVFKNALRIYLTKVAEDTATYVASGGKGQKPLFLSKPGQYFQDLSDAAIGDYLDTLSTQALGSSLCDLGPVTYKINLSLRNELNPNFCSDGCQRTYEQKLQTIQPHIRARNAVQKSLNDFRLPILRRGAEVCPSFSDEASCNGYQEAGLQYCEWLGPPNLDTGCFPNQNISRPMTEADVSGASQENFSIADIQAVLQICKGGSAAAEPDLADCYYKLSAHIDTNQQKWSSDLKLCKVRCTGERRTAKCTLTDITNNVEKLYNESSFSASASTGLFKANETGPGRYLSQWEASRSAAATAKEAEKENLTFTQVGPLRSTVTKETITPSTFTEAQAKKAVDEAGSEVDTYTGSPLADAIGVFTDTLTKKLIERIFNKGIAQDTSKGKVLLGGGAGFSGGGYNSAGITSSRAQFAQSFSPVLTTESNVNVDTVTQLENDGTIDKDFAEAIRQGLTLEEAVKKNLVHGDWWFGYTDQKAQPKTGNAGYPADSFAILRTHRIIPVGWEIAAEYIKNIDVSRAFTVSDLMGKFSDTICPTNTDQLSCESSASCLWNTNTSKCSSAYQGLIDPKWVLKAPMAICAKQGYGEKLVDGSCQVSEVSQITNDDNNGCSAGEHDTNGDGKCNTDDPAVFENSCEREQICIDDQTCVRESLDGKSCIEYGYCTKEKPIWRFAGTACSEQYASCQGYLNMADETVSYLTNTVDRGTCSVDNAGCQWYCQKVDPATGQFQCTQGSDANKMYFDRDVEKCDSGDEGCTKVLRTVNSANIFPNSNFEFFNLISPDQQADFVGWVIGGNNQTCGAQAFVDGFASSGTSAMRLQQLAACGGGNQYAQAVVPTGLPVAGRQFTLTVSALANNPPTQLLINIGTDPAVAGQPYTFDLSSGYQRFAATHYFDPATIPPTATDIIVRINTVDNKPIVLDQIMLEESANASTYKEYGDSAIFIKTPPSQLTCTGASTDPAECSKFAKSCAANDVGCDAFTPVNGGPTIPGKVTNPASCDFTTPDPTKCDQCPAAYAGCKAIRELALTAPIPDPAFPARLQQEVSVVPDSGKACGAQFVGCEEYTNLDVVAQGGEGREYFSKLRQCVEPDDPELRFYFSWVGSASTGYELKRWQLKKSNLGNAPCTHLRVSGQKNEICVDTAANIQDCQASWPGDPGCVQFFDEFNGTHYRYLDQTIIASEACRPYRNTLDSNTYYFESSLSTACPSEFAGCREFKGAGANNTSTIFTSTFESTIDPLEGWVPNFGGGVQTESTAFGGHSLLVSQNMPGATKQANISQGKTYFLSFWYKPGAAGNDIYAFIDGAPITRFFTYNSLNPTGSTTPSVDDWQLYRFGPLEVDWTLPADPKVHILAAGSGGWFDNIELQTTTDNLFIVHNSASRCDGFENCAEYSDRQGAKQFLKSFTRLCQENAVGCEAVIDTHNSLTPASQTLDNEQKYRQADGTTFSNNVPADSIRYLVNDQSKYCSSAAKGCMAMGLPTTTVDPNTATVNVTAYRDVYLKNDPDAFEKTLCSENELSCGEYREIENESSLAYFKDPGAQLCEYREGNTSSGASAGWFIKGSNTVCPETGGWVKSCPMEQSTCREYKAPRVYANPASPGLQSYFYLDKSLNKSQCQQGIDPANNCLGFTDIKAGDPNSRPKLDPNDPTKIISQICQKCSNDTNTCGRNGTIACCTWDPGVCSLDRAQGLDAAAPHYCIYEQTENDFDGDGTPANPGCTNDLANAFAVPNSFDLALATNCDSNAANRTGKPLCFLPDLSDYDATKRWCGDFSCNVNVVLPVTADRKCDEWLACTNEQTLTRNNVKTTVCLERALRNADGFISTGAKENKQENLVYDFSTATPANFRDIANYSGMVKAGMIFPNGRLVDGFFPYGRMTETGLDGALITIPDNEFEDHKIAVNESPMPVLDASPGGSSWIDVSLFDWKTFETAAGEKQSRLQLSKSDEPTQFSNQYLSVSALKTGTAASPLIVGAMVQLNTPEMIISTVESYSLTFKARKTTNAATNIKVFLFQDEPSAKQRVLYQSDSIVLTNDWQTFTIPLAQDVPIDNTGNDAIVSLRFEYPATVIGESFDIDSVSLKPVLQKKNTAPTTFDQFVNIPRECRSFPQANSLQCDYVDSQSQVVYNGFKGYCVERNPRNPNECLTWLPIDVLVGEKNIFTQSEKSLTRAPLYYCAETQKKTLNISPLPRYVCLSTWAKDDNANRSGQDTGCLTMAIVSKPLPAAYELTPFDQDRKPNWVYGNGTAPASDNCNINPDTDTPQCCPLKDFAPQSGKEADSCTNAELIRFHDDDSDYFDIINPIEWNRCLNQLKQYWGDIIIRNFLDDGNGFPEGCGGDNKGDGNDNCTDSGDNGRQNDCEYAQVYDSSSGTRSYVQRGCASGGDICANAGNRWTDIPDYPTGIAFPVQCTKLVQVTTASGESKPWTSRIQNGSTLPRVGLPVPYRIELASDTMCGPWGAVPVISSPIDIKSCIPDPANPAFDCDIVDGKCQSLTKQGGNCIWGPMEMYHPNNPDNNKIDQVCTETRLGGGFWSCGLTDAQGRCRTATTSPYNGLSDPNGMTTFSTGEVYGDGAERLKLLFARSYGFWKWNDLLKRYEKDPTIANWLLPNSKCLLSPDQHIMNDGLCGIRPTVSDIKVNGNTGSTILVSSRNPGGNRNIELTFNYSINQEQTPLSFVAVDWGDGNPVSAYTPDAINKIYRCDSNDGINCQGVCPGTGAVPVPRTDPSGQIHASCVYANYPRVQIHDNWDWCNNSNAADNTRCTADTTRWGNFSGEIVVFP